MRPRVCPQRRSPRVSASVLIMRTIVLVLRTGGLVRRTFAQASLPSKGIYLVRLGSRGVGGGRRRLDLRLRRGAAEHAIGTARQHLVLLQRQADTALHLAHGAK